MKTLFFALLIVAAVCGEMLVTQEYTDFLKKHVTWEVSEYEDNVFRGWTIEEMQSILSQNEDPEDMPTSTVQVSDTENLPSSVNWRESSNCVHEIHNQGNCGSCWAFSAASVVSDRCCLRLKDHGWLAPQELVSCDRSGSNSGCNGGWEFDALNYVAKNGLVPESCFPYLARATTCPTKCKDASDWAQAHVCKCNTRVFCQGPDAMKTCIQTGPVTAGLWVYRDFVNYKSGIYHWSKTGQRLGGHAIRCYGYSDTPEEHWMCANSWGTSWGEKGFFRIGKGEAGIDTRNPSYCDPYQ